MIVIIYNLKKKEEPSPAKAPLEQNSGSSNLKIKNNIISKDDFLSFLKEMYNNNLSQLLGYGNFSDIYKQILNEPNFKDIMNNILNDPSLLEIAFNNPKIKKMIQNNPFLKNMHNLSLQNLHMAKNYFNEDEKNMNESSNAGTSIPP